MDLNGLFRMLTRMVLNKPVRAGIDFAARRGKPEAAMTPEEREQARKGRKLAQRARELSRVTRRFWR